MATINNRGRGPEIAGTRITVYDILDYYLDGSGPATIAATLRIASDQVMAAIEYIETHREEVLANYQKILDRCAQGNPPELQARLDAMHSKYESLWADRLKNGHVAGDADEGDSRGH
jgi:uncharacterized protein (DUF433 family)